MKLFAHIRDLTGTADGVQGLVLGVATVAETDEEAATLQDVGAIYARTEEDLAELIGPEQWPYHVPAPNAQCAGWYYDGDTFTDITQGG